jgi:hypothetical protein
MMNKDKDNDEQIYHIAQRLADDYNGRIDLDEAAKMFSSSELISIIEALDRGILDITNTGIIHLKFSYLLQHMTSHHSTEDYL